MKQAQKVVRFDWPKEQAAHQIINGLVNITNGLATISNSAGDRHGLVAGQSIDDPGLAQLAVHAAGTVGYCVYRAAFTWRGWFCAQRRQR